jgi:hypothetical protein
VIPLINAENMRFLKEVSEFQQEHVADMQTHWKQMLEDKAESLAWLRDYNALDSKERIYDALQLTSGARDVASYLFHVLADKGRDLHYDLPGVVIVGCAYFAHRKLNPDSSLSLPHFLWVKHMSRDILELDPDVSSAFKKKKHNLAQELVEVFRAAIISNETHRFIGEDGSRIPVNYVIHEWAKDITANPGENVDNTEKDDKERNARRAMKSMQWRLRAVSETSDCHSGRRRYI